ncbi:hypothetical protein TI04_04105 [Achromatium sp. WMS2]|nr:hypothetical protein TI04_04105 [Achromatium sp. WMS2]
MVEIESTLKKARLYNASKSGPKSYNDRVSVIFLDIDGVLRPEPTMSTICLGSGQSAFSPLSVGLLNRLCKVTNAELVITSSWRKRGQTKILEQLDKAILALNNLLASDEVPVPSHLKLFNKAPQAPESWRTPIGNFYERGAQIDSWLKTWGHWVHNYCILDDVENLIPRHLQSKFIWIKDAELGFDVYHYRQALAMLSKS